MKLGAVIGEVFAEREPNRDVIGLVTLKDDPEPADEWCSASGHAPPGGARAALEGTWARSMAQP